MAIKENPYFDIPKLETDIKAFKYEMTFFEDEVVENPWTFEHIPMGTSTQGYPINHLNPMFGEVIQEGKDLSQKNLGNMDVGIYLLYLWKDWVNAQIMNLMLKGDASDGAILNGFLAVQYYANLKKLDGNIIILDGCYDEARGELWV